MSGHPEIAVVGANGFIGSRIVEMLHLEGRAVVRPVVRRRSALAPSSRFGLVGRVADARDRVALGAAFERIDVVVHAVAGDPETIAGTVGPVFEVAEESGCRRLVYLSTACVHGQAPESGTDESSLLSDRQPIAYNNVKVSAERELFERRRGASLEVVALRPGIVFGPRSQWTAGLADALLAGEAYLVDGGSGICNSVYVDNLVSAVWLAATAAEADGKAYLVGDDEAPTWRSFYRAISEPLGIPIDAVPVVQYHPPRPSPRRLVEAANRSVAAQALRRVLPGGARRALAALRDSIRNPPDATAPPEPTLEMALLHRCGYRLPWSRIRDELAYRPQVEFAEAVRRSIGWLGFAGYPVVESDRQPVGAANRRVP